jgi:hypothetical protein
LVPQERIQGFSTTQIQFQAHHSRIKHQGFVYLECFWTKARSASLAECWFAINPVNHYARASVETKRKALERVAALPGPEKRLAASATLNCWHGLIRYKRHSAIARWSDWILAGVGIQLIFLPSE